ncbi:ankycorbin isoform X2 [Nematostella vectensis]|nr:ankycorbin isoform X2 [Nematostella vectensis]
MEANISVQDKSGSTILHVAAKAGHIECVQRVLDLGVDSNCQDGKRMTPLHLATAKGHMEVVQLLVGCNASLNITDKDGRTPLLMAIQSGHEEIVCLLLDKGAKVNIADNAKKTALMYASLLGLTKCVETLLKRGANSRLVDSQSHTAEDYARIGGHKEVIAIIKNAPTVATWDAGENSEEEEEEPEIPNGELVSAFSNQDSEEMSIASHQNIVPSSQMVWIDTSSRSSGSFSSKTSTAISSPRASLSMPGRDLTLEIKELEEENEVLNQELGKLRVQHQKTLDRLRFTETELEAERKKSPSPSPLKNSRQMNGSIEEDLTEWKDHKIEALELEVSKLQVDLQNERTSRKETEEKVEKLKAQVTSYESRVNGDVNHNDSTISLSVYEQLKESSEEEIFSLTERIQGLTLANETLEKEVLESRRNIEKSNQETMAGIKSSAEQSHKKFLESEVNRLRKQIKSAEAEHERRINMYRIHLISAVQGELDADVEGALQTIISLRASEQFC